MSERPGAWTRAKEAIRNRFVKEKPPETIDSTPGEDQVDFAIRLRRKAEKNTVVGAYHNRGTSTMFTVPKGADLDGVITRLRSKIVEDQMMLRKLRKEYEAKKSAPAHAESPPPKLLEDMTDNVVDIDEFMSALDTLDFKDVGKVLGWCVSFVESRSPNEMAKIFKERILATFAEHGYTPGMNRGYQYKPVNAEDRDSAGGCIIGDMLSGIDTNEPFVRAMFLANIRREYDEWREKFETKSAPEVAPAEELRRLG